MRKFIIILIAGMFSILTAGAQLNYGVLSGNPSSQSTSQNACITFRNKSGYTMTLRILHAEGGHFRTVTLPPNSSSTVDFYKTSSYKLKIKAVANGQASYHDGGTFSVICTRYEWTEGEMSFSLSSYGNGLGPKISAKEFESNY